MTTRTSNTSASQFLLDLLSPERRDLVNDLVDVLRQYNDNMSQYSATVNALVALISSRTSQRTPGRPNWPLSGLGAQATQGISLADLLNPRTNVFTDDQVEAIRRDTETFNYHAAGEDATREVSVCPITHEPFQDGESVMRIRRCGHTFKRSALMQWFGIRLSCPLCRGDMT